VNLQTDLSWNSMQGGLLAYLMSESRNGIFAHIERALAPLNITVAQFRVVVGIAHERARTLSEFAVFLDYDSGAMKRLLDRIEDKGIIRRVRCMDDRRTVILELTDQGRAIYPAIMEAVTRVHREMLQGFSDVEVAQFQYLLQKLIANAGR